MVMKLLWLAVGGGLGTVSRYGLSGLAQRLSNTLFPWGTLAVNILGCLAFGILWSAFENRIQISPEYRLIILTGFMGAFTTFSTFMFETGQLMREGQYLWALGNIGLQNGIGIIAVFLGLLIGKFI